MLQRLSEPVRECLRRAAEAKAQADAVSDPELKKSYSELEGNWLFLAGSYTLSESVQYFVGRQRKKKEREPVDPRLPVVGQLFDLLPLAIYIGDASVQNREIVVERADGSHVVALASIHPFKDRMGNVLGAVNCFQDITRRKRRERQIAALAGEADRPTKNILAILHGSKDTIEARIGALGKVHALFVQSGGAGAKLSSIARQELAACFSAVGLRARIGGPDLLLAPHTAQ